MSDYTKTFAGAPLPDKLIGTLPTSNPTASDTAHGRAPASGVVSVQVSGACVLSIFTRMQLPNRNTWLNPGASSANYQKTFAAAGWDYFVVPPGSEYFIKSDTGSITGYHSGKEI